MKDAITRIVNAASRAPTPDNSQPFYFESHSNKLSVYVDLITSKHILNINNHALYLSLGFVYESIQIAAEAEGLLAHFQTNLFLNDKNNLISEIIFEKTVVTKNLSNLNSVLFSRKTERSIFLKYPRLQQNTLDVINRFATDNTKIHITDQLNSELVNHILKCENILFENTNVFSDVFKWVRFFKKDIDTTNDGLAYDSINLNKFDSVILYIIYRFPILLRIFSNFGLAYTASLRNKKLLLNSSNYILFTTENHTAENLIEVGRIVCKTWLILNQINFGVHPYSFCSLLAADLKIYNQYPRISTQHKKRLSRGQSLFKDQFNLPDTSHAVWLIRTGSLIETNSNQLSKRKPINSILKFH